jgi:hypothetical protein
VVATRTTANAQRSVSCDHDAIATNTDILNHHLQPHNF